jgi:integrase
MRGVHIQPRSPFYWVRYYDKKEINPNKRRKSFCSKIEITAADRRRYEEAKKAGIKYKVQGNPEIRDVANNFRMSLLERDLLAKTGIKLLSKKKLLDGYKEFIEARTVPGSKDQLKDKTIQNYDLAVKHMVDACGNKFIMNYTGEKDYVTLLQHFENIKVPGKTVMQMVDGKNTPVKQYKVMSMNSRSMYTRALRSLWNFFVEKKYAVINIIEPIEEDRREPEPIPLNDMWRIISFFKARNRIPQQHQIVMFMAFTGCRPSSAIVQLKEDIDFHHKIIKIKNVKTSKAKSDNFYLFPIFPALEELLKEMGVKKGDTGRLFDYYPVVPVNYTYPLQFWDRGIETLLAGRLISKHYTIKQIRSTTANLLVDVLRIDLYDVQKLLDHSNVKTTQKSYLRLNLKRVRNELSEFSLNSYIRSLSLFITPSALKIAKFY